MAGSSQLQSSGMLSREKLLQLFDRFSFITSRSGSYNCYDCNPGRNVFADGGCEEMVCEESELGAEGFKEKMHARQNLQEQQLGMLNQMRKFHLDDQSAILEKLHQQMENADFEGEASVLPLEQIQEIVQRRVAPLFRPG